MAAKENIVAKNMPEPESDDLTGRTSFLKLNLEIAAGTRLELDISAKSEDGTHLKSTHLVFKNPSSPTPPDLSDIREQQLSISMDTKPRPSTLGSTLKSWMNGFRTKILKNNQGFVSGSLEWLLWLAIGIYLLTRLIGLENFPIYFFTDEAVQTVNAADFIRDDFQSFEHEFLPTYFVNGNQYNLGTSVYLQVIPYLVFGKSIFVTRATSAITTVLAALSLGLVLKHVFKSRFSWLGVMFLSITPAWFLHSRTAFETALATTFFAAFLYAYMMYREVNPRYFYWAVGMGALSFYSYSPAQLVVGVSAVFLLFSDWRYHWQNRKVVLLGLGLGLLLALPYFRFLLEHGEENYQHLVILHSYWISDISLFEKLRIFFTQYLHGLNPAYWYLPNLADFTRHQMKDYGHILRFTFPFALFGLWQVIRNFRKSAYRTVLVALLAAPTGAALVELGITRALFMVIPLALLTALGASAVLDWLIQRKIPAKALAWGTFLILAAVNIYMLVDALRNSPTWFDDYGLGGMQYGARQIFSEIRDYLQEDPQANIILSPSWANGTDVLARFFFDDPIPFRLGSIDGYMNEELEIRPDTVFIMIPEEYQRAVESNKFTDIQVESIMPYPNGEPGFYFVRLQYVPNIHEILAAEETARRELLESTLTLQDGETITVRYPQMDMGDVYTLFDGDLLSIARTYEANPMRILIAFENAHTLSGLDVRVGGVETEVSVIATLAVSGEIVHYVQRVAQNPDPRIVSMDFGSPITVSNLEVDIRSVRDGEPAHVHVWEITLR